MPNLKGVAEQIFHQWDWRKAHSAVGGGAMSSRHFHRWERDGKRQGQYIKCLLYYRRRCFGSQVYTLNAYIF
jgi:hypothetical protein